MKISICSDVHLEFGAFDLQNKDDADVLILSGDILLAASLTPPFNASARQVRVANDFGEFMEAASGEFKHVVYVMGNHEHYHHDFICTVADIRGYLDDLTNIHVLDSESITLEGIRFFGATLWTDMNGGDPITMNVLRNYMNDFNCVKNGHELSGDEFIKGRQKYFTPEDALFEFKTTKKLLEEELRTNQGLKTVVVTHHAPSKQSTHPRYAKDVHISGGYSSNMDDFILQHPEIALWTHGHTHERFDYKIGETRIVANPRGYIGHEPCADTFALKTVEI